MKNENSDVKLINLELEHNLIIRGYIQTFDPDENQIDTNMTFSPNNPGGCRDPSASEIFFLKRGIFIIFLKKKK